MKSVVGLALAAATLLVSRPSEACSPLYNFDHVTDPAYADDVTPPGAPYVALRSVTRHGDNGGGGASCAGLSQIELGVAATDDRAPADQLGYQVTVLSPESPVSGFGDRIVKPQLGTLFMRFDFDAEPFDLDLEVRAVDLNGNVGEPTTYSARIEPPDVDDGGCSAGGASPGWLGLAALALLRRRRR
ncbi:MAG: hypothetical protein HOV81_33070 [Kofleriaceae bacterium]|nr:hypothetical protein [Kofleriaceae bacterium]